MLTEVFTLPSAFCIKTGKLSFVPSKPGLRCFSFLLTHMPGELLKTPSLKCIASDLHFLLPRRSVQTFADKSKQEALKNDLVEALKRKQQS